MFGSRLILAALLGLLTPRHVIARDRPEYWETLGQELFGSHFEWARGMAFSTQNDLDDRTDLVVIPPVSLDIVPNMTMPCFNITLPIINKMIFDLVEPCGSIHMPADGITFKTPFGSYHVSGMDEINNHLDTLDHAFGKYSVWVMGGLFIFYALYNVAVSSKRLAMIEQFQKMRAGTVASEEEDASASEAEKAQAKKDKLDINSAKFICPGNIYRLVTVLHPGVVGFAAWGQYCMKAGICAYMQLYLPINIMTHCFKIWQFNGVKSPVYYLMFGSSFFMQYLALASVCTLFASKTASVIETDCLACYYLLSHDPEAEADEEKPAAGGSKVAPLLDKAALPKIKPPQWILNWNEFGWCLVNMAVTCISSVCLMAAMYMKVATFQGDVTNIAIVTAALYFVFDLDEKVMDSSPTLRPRFRRQVLKQTVKTKKDPRWAKTMASYTVGIINATIPLGLLMIMIVSWRSILNADGTPFHAGQKPSIIGGNPFHQ
jgi:hypothetical protein